MRRMRREEKESGMAKNTKNRTQTLLFAWWNESLGRTNEVCKGSGPVVILDLG